jgi:hypothetical protein
MSYILSVPATTSYVERVFSIMTNKWTDVRNKSRLDLIKSELLITLNFNFSCKEFFNYVTTDQKMLSEARSSDKYNV